MQNIFRLSPGREVRLKSAYFITCTDYKTDEAGNVSEIYCTYDPESKGGQSPDGRKVKGTLHWVSAESSINAEIRLYDRLCFTENPSDIPEDGSLFDILNPNSLRILSNAKLEPSLSDAKPGSRFQFIRNGYFCCDPDSKSGNIVFNRIVPLRDSWAKISGKG